MDYCDLLMAVGHLPDVIGLTKLLTERFHNKFSRTKASTLNVAEFCREYEPDNTKLKDMFIRFNSAWNTVAKHYGSMFGDCYPLHQNNMIQFWTMTISNYLYF